MAVVPVPAEPVWVAPADTNGEDVPVMPKVAATSTRFTPGPIAAETVSGMIEPGADLRDINGEGGAPAVAGIPLPPVVGGSVVALALRLLRQFMRTPGRVTRASWEQLPGWAQTALTAVGIGIGFDLARDIPGVPGSSGILDVLGGDDDSEEGGVSQFPAIPEHLTPHMVDGHLGAHIIGSWEANGVTFYRLSDGKLAVQNKKGRWKVWRPKKPIVLYAGGASNLKTMLRADAVLTKQAKQIEKFLIRRLGKRKSRSAPAAASKEVVVIEGARGTHT